MWRQTYLVSVVDIGFPPPLGFWCKVLWAGDLGRDFGSVAGAAADLNEEARRVAGLRGALSDLIVAGVSRMGEQRQRRTQRTQRKNAEDADVGVVGLGRSSEL